MKISSLTKALMATSLVTAVQAQWGTGLTVGQQVCVEGYVMVSFALSRWVI